MVGVSFGLLRRRALKAWLSMRVTAARSLLVR